MNKYEKPEINVISLNIEEDTTMDVSYNPDGDEW